jgi:hypothetical protein
MAIEFLLTHDVRKVRRTIYDLLGVLGDVGGVQELIISILGVFLYSMSEQSYYLKFMKDLFFAKQISSSIQDRN